MSELRSGRQQERDPGAGEVIVLEVPPLGADVHGVLEQQQDGVSHGLLLSESGFSPLQLVQQGCFILHRNNFVLQRVQLGFQGLQNLFSKDEWVSWGFKFGSTQLGTQDAGELDETGPLGVVSEHPFPQHFLKFEHLFLVLARAPFKLISDSAEDSFNIELLL